MKVDHIRDRIMRNICESEPSDDIEEAVNTAYDHIYESVTRTLEDLEARGEL